MMRVRTMRRTSSMVCGAALLFVWGTAIAAGNWIINSGFDTSIAGWTNPFSRPAAWNAADGRGVPDSGSALVTNQGLSNGGTPIAIGQCVPLTPLTAYTFGARLRVPGGQPADTAAEVFVDVYASGDCSGVILRAENLDGSSSTWEQKSNSFTTGATVHSGFVALGVWKPSGVSADASALFDTVVLRQSGLPFALGPSMSASWFDPSQSGHGIMLELLGSNSAWMCWFTFDLTGNRAWICGLGNISGNTVDFPDAFIVTGGKFPPLFDALAIGEVPWGHVTVAFTGCDAGTMTWTTSTAGFTSGSMPLARLTSLWANGCSP